MEKLLLLDEFDNTLNPSLIEALFIVIKEFFIDKGTMVIITTHSPVTISLAPEYTQFYEFFRIENDSPKIVKVNKEKYSELEIANKAFYEKIENQKERISKLEEKINQLKAKDEAYQDFCDLKEWWNDAKGNEIDGIYKVNNMNYLKLNKFINC